MEFLEEFINGADNLVESNDYKNRELKERYEEIKDILKKISDNEIRKPFDNYCNDMYKDYPELPRLTKPQKSPQPQINKIIKEKLTCNAWAAETPIYYKKDVENVEENESLKNIRMDFSKPPIAMEVTLNHGSDIEHNLLKPWLAIQDTGITKIIQNFQMAVIITPTNLLKKNANMDSAVGSYEKWKLYFKLFQRLNLGPYILIGLQPFQTFKVLEEREQIPQLSKKTGKPLAAKKGKLLKVWTQDI
tara:strand:- start:1369 stop:2109 length:741 start_codon:yes stop_codon:yes gene_type:complete